VEGTCNGESAAGAKAALEAAIEEAAACLDSPGATQAEIDQALGDLEDALVAFDSKRVFVNSLALREAIETAQDLYDSAVEGTSNGQYAAGAKAALQAAIDEAAAWLDSPGATQAEIDQALEDLEDALEAFDSKRVFVNWFALREAIGNAQDLYDSAEEGTAIGQYKAGAKAALLAAINAAIMPFETPGSTQADVDAALAALRTAVSAFEAKKIVSRGPGGGGGGMAPEYPRTYPVDVMLDPKTTEKLMIRQTLESDGRLFDTIELPENFAENAASLLHAAGRDRLTIEITPSLTEATDFAIDLSSLEAHVLAASGIALDIRTPTANLVLPSATLQGLNGPLTIRLSSIEGTTAGSELEGRAKEEAKRRAGTDEVTFAGHSISIATNQPLNRITLSVPAENLKDTGNSGFYLEDGEGKTGLVRSSAEGTQAGRLSLELDLHANAKLAGFSVKNWPGEETEQGQEESWQLRKLPYLSGFEGGAFKPNADVTRAELAAILSRIIDGRSVAEPKPFADIPSAHWAKSAVEEVVGLGLMSGTADGRFLPDKPVTRAELAAILTRLPFLAAAGKEAESFPDTAGHWAEAAILKARSAGLMNGFADGTFKPDRFLSRAEAVVILNKLIGLQAVRAEAPFYADVPRTYWAFQAIQAASIH
ncbi:S-layer homology domain-containing protein, partial [Cohnella sp. AR92]|uniref:S-layer homology domain-containing protein n=1 Tax=Cohnella sp. AR92 TaxID=648716 RepID=UPI000FBEE6E5